MPGDDSEAEGAVGKAIESGRDHPGFASENDTAGSKIDIVGVLVSVIRTRDGLGGKGRAVNSDEITAVRVGAEELTWTLVLHAGVWVADWVAEGRITHILAFLIQQEENRIVIFRSRSIPRGPASGVRAGIASCVAARAGAYLD